MAGSEPPSPPISAPSSSAPPLYPPLSNIEDVESEPPAGYETFLNSDHSANVWTFETDSQGNSDGEGSDADEDFENFQSAAPMAQDAADPGLADLMLRGLENEYLSDVARQPHAAAAREMSAVTEEPSEELFPASASSPAPAMPPIPPLKVSSSASKKPPVTLDAAAVSRAISNIRLKAPKLAQTLDRGAMLVDPSNALGKALKKPSPSVLSLPSHPIIPPGPLSAFVNAKSAKAVQASSNLTRACTAAQALDILDLAKGAKPLTLHIVGPDIVECETVQSVKLHFDPLVRWLNHFRQSKKLPGGVTLHLVGPCIPTGMDGVTVDLSTDGCKAHCHAGLYHSFLESHDVPTLALSYNSGVWGYDSWDETLAFVCKRSSGKEKSFYFVFTGYTIEEVEDDYEKIEKIATADGAKSNICVFEPEKNMYGSRAVRETKGSEREYRENSSWQCWSVGL
jgi:hypothetical protein